MLILKKVDTVRQYVIGCCVSITAFDDCFVIAKLSDDIELDINHFDNRAVEFSNVLAKANPSVRMVRDPSVPLSWHPNWLDFVLELVNTGYAKEIKSGKNAD